MSGIPVDRLLVPDVAPTAPAGTTELLQRLVRGLPQTLPLDAQDSLALAVPTGLATDWRDADPALVVASADDERSPAPPAAADAVAAVPDSLPRPPARLLLRRGRRFVAGVPLVLGVHRFLPDDGASGAVVELAVLDYRLHAGTLCGAGDFGSFVRLAWRRCDAGADTFALPPLSPLVAARFAGQVQSPLGGGEGA